ncbi:MAG: hypothetical protein WKF91_19060, partial [Segetibacter sp.]
RCNAAPGSIQFVEKESGSDREVEIGTYANKNIEKPWYNFHMLIDTAVALATRRFKLCLYII